MIDAFDHSIRTVRIASFGGDVDRALRIERHIRDQNIDLIGSEYCMSSCANYFIPAARSVIVEENTIACVHGTANSSAHIVRISRSFGLNAVQLFWSAAPIEAFLL